MYQRLRSRKLLRGKIVASSIFWAILVVWFSSCSNSIANVMNNGDTEAVDTVFTAATNSTKGVPYNNILNAEEDTGLPIGVQLLAGDDSYSDHFCTCQSSASALDPNHSTSFNRPILPVCFNNNRANAGSYDVKKSIEHGIGKCASRIFYLVTIHNNRTLSDALYVFRGIRDLRNIVVFHIDVKFGIESYINSPLHKEIEACPCGSRVEVASVHDCKWGSWSMNAPTLWGMEKAITTYNGKWDVFINLSGDSLPVYSPNRVARLFGSGPLRGINFITSSACETGLIPTPLKKFPQNWHKRSHYSHQPATELEYVDDKGITHRNIEVDIFFGSQWMSLTTEFCEFIIRNLARSDSLPSRFRDWLIETKKLMSDETFFTSMLMRYFPQTVPNITKGMFLDADTSEESISMYAIRYERMDEHVPTSSGYFPTEQRYEVPDSTGVEKPRSWGPYFLGVYDLNNIRLSGALFVRKVAQAIDPNIYRILPVDEPHQIPPISWPNDVQVSPVPDWSNRLDQLRKQAEKKVHK